jgi:DNA-binding GntR family transcriptional regulator
LTQAEAEGKGETLTHENPNYMLSGKYSRWDTPLGGPDHVRLTSLSPLRRPKQQMINVKQRTLVEQSADLIIDAASVGTFLPGDRLVEADIARQIGISRVPVREALRLLESQGVVVSIPYRGMRLMAVTNSSAASITRVRVALEAMAVRDCVAYATDAALDEVRDAARQYRAAEDADPLGQRRADRAFHRALCVATGNAALLSSWTAIVRQVSVLWSLVDRGSNSGTLASEHEAIVDAIAARDAGRAASLVEEHLAPVMKIDFESALQRKIVQRG